MYLLNCLAKDHKTLKPLNIWGPRTICITMAGQRRINLLYAFYLTFTKDFRHISAAGNLPGDSRIPDPAASDSTRLALSTPTHQWIPVLLNLS